MNAGEAYRLVMSAVTNTNQDQARLQLDEALRHDPQSKLACYHLGMIYAGRGLHDQAITWYRRIIDEIDETDPGIWFLLARQYHLHGQFDEARATYLRTFEMDPLCEKACLYVAQILLQQGSEPAQAEWYAQKALTLRSASSMVPRVVFEEALETARQAVARSKSTSAGGPGPLDSDLSRARLGDLVGLNPMVEPILAKHGIRCAGCAGYEDEPLVRAATEVDADVDLIVSEITQTLSWTQATVSAPTGSVEK